MLALWEIDMELGSSWTSWSGGKPQHITTEPRGAGVAGENGEFLLLIAQNGIVTVAGIDQRIVGEHEELLGDGY